MKTRTQKSRRLNRDQALMRRALLGLEALEGRQLMATMASPAVSEIVVTKDLDIASTNLMSPTMPDDGGAGVPARGGRGHLGDPCLSDRKH